MWVRLTRACVPEEMWEQVVLAVKNPETACEICGKVGEPLQMDHDHVAEKFRGLLCNLCNKGIGLFGDDIEVLQGAVDYLNRA